MDIDGILGTFNRFQVEYLLIGGVNFLLRHRPISTFDVDLWIEDSPANHERAKAALASLGAEWGLTESDWKSVAELPADWLQRQFVFCLTSQAGSIDIFRSVTGLGAWAQSRQSSVAETTNDGTPYQGISDADMLKCQLALMEGQRKLDRISVLESVLRSATGES